MPTVVKMDLSPAVELLQRRGLGRGSRAQQFLTQEIAGRMERYMPYQSGALIKQKNIGVLPQEGKIVVDAPQARYLYYGELMLSPSGSAWAKENEQKHRAGKPLEYDKSNNALAGPLWEKRMWDAEKDEILAGLADLVGGKRK